MKRKNNFVNGLLEDLNKTSRYLSEAYIFDGEGGPEGDPTIPQQQPQVAQQGDSQEEVAMHAQEVIKHEPIIGKIRETAIEGIKELLKKYRY